MLDNPEGRIANYLRVRPLASNGELARAFNIRPASAARFRKRALAAGLIPDESLRDYTDDNAVR